ncbi:hypothetical protein ALO36_103375 [Pseudomonas syringae pv. tomato]|uniref:Uncharacterized protein n=1 Tax=Pseudomonas syringae pv. tomato (strain ATCC BAA-871 / DC3000) TaxID=223283 RepID=Q88BV7_PSESM|nr:hypothetical protein PSPTO_B0015 [Pseudomonas syringae pv. tomato str. DC3000]KPY90696.1 hypothetical protein ALO36_103375 [Pseudomonas syringae pv. tomato]MBW8024758.1 hypothetical protein [Pseudomonas syringae pv. tomato]PYD02551.1 hypothetical protein DND90_32985 [Pseudomonas syringae pv. maculicola]
MPRYKLSPAVKRGAKYLEGCQFLCPQEIWSFIIQVEVSPTLLTTLEQVNELSKKRVLEDDKNEADCLGREYSRERMDLLMLLHAAVEATETANTVAKR